MSLVAKWHWNDVHGIEMKFIFEASVLNNCGVSQQQSQNYATIY